MAARIAIRPIHHIGPANGWSVRIFTFREGFDDRIVYDVAYVPSLALRDPGNGLCCREDFLRFCNVQHWPQIQFGI